MIPVGSVITLKGSSVAGIVIGHDEGEPIVQFEPRVIGADLIGSYTDEKGLVRIPFYLRIADNTKER